MCSAAGVVGSSAHHEQGRFPLSSSSSTPWTYLHCYQVTPMVSWIFHCSHLLHTTHFLQVHSGSSRQGVIFQKEIDASRCLPQIISYFLNDIPDYHDLTYGVRLWDSWDGFCVCVGRCVIIHTRIVQPGRCKRKRGRPAIDVLLVGGIQLGIRIVLIG